jgi:hypothetical protein
MQGAVSRHSKSGDSSMTLRSWALAAALLLATVPAAFAQSHQGGYLGLNPGNDIAARTSPLAPSPPVQGSGQGGYLGLNNGEHLGPTVPQPTTGMMGWCVHSPDPSHCRGRAVVEHEICKDKSNYETCRQVVDQMHNGK